MLYEYGFIDAVDVTMVKMWIAFLSNVGYSFPALASQQSSNHGNIPAATCEMLAGLSQSYIPGPVLASHMLSRYDNVAHRCSSLCCGLPYCIAWNVYSPGLAASVGTISNTSATMVCELIGAGLRDARQLVLGMEAMSGVVARSAPLYSKGISKYLLIVNFHWEPTRDGVEYIHKYYQSCMPDYFDYTFVTAPGGEKHGYLVNPYMNTGAQSYYSFNIAFSAFPRYAGYFFINDDVYVSFWNISEKLLASSWGTFDPYSQPRNITLCDSFHNVWHWGLAGPRGGTFCEAQRRASMSYRGPFAVNGNADVFYVTQQDAVAFYNYSNVCLDSGCFLETAIPSFFMTFSINTTYVTCTRWGEGRSDPNTMFGPHCITTHPVKFSKPHIREWADRVNTQYCTAGNHHITTVSRNLYYGS